MGWEKDYTYLYFMITQYVIIFTYIFFFLNKVNF